MKKFLTIMFATATLYSCKKTDVQPQQDISYTKANSFVATRLQSYQAERKLEPNSYRVSNELFYGLGNNNRTVSLNMDYVFKNGYTGPSSLPVNNLTPEVSSMANNFLREIKYLDSSEQLSGLFQKYMNRVATSNISPDDKNVLNAYFGSVKASVDFISANLGVKTDYSFWQAVKCAAGTVGGAVLGGLAGAAVGTVTLPLIGTVSGSAVGFWGGALSGIAVAC